MADTVFHDICHSFLNFMDPRITVFINSAAGCTDNMVMLLAQIGLLKLSNVFTKLMLDHQPAVQQQFHCVIKRCPANPVIFVLHVDI